MSQPDAMQGSIDIRVRYAECDPMGVVHHAVYPIWLEMGRTELLRSTGLAYRDLEERGIFLAIVDLRLKYKRPARYDDRLTLHTRLDEVSRVRIEHAYSLERDGLVLVTASSTLACLDRDGRPRAIPAEIGGGDD